MTSATGKATRRRHGFTILEMVLVLGLIALAGAIVVANFASMAERGGQLSTEESIQAAIKQARFVAASERTTITLAFDEATGSLIASSGDSFPLGPEYSKEGRGEIRFFIIPPAEGLSAFKEASSTTLEANEVSFAPDRSSSPFVVEIDTGSGTPGRIVYDAFSSLRRKSE